MNHYIDSIQHDHEVRRCRARQRYSAAMGALLGSDDLASVGQRALAREGMQRELRAINAEERRCVREIVMGVTR